MSITINDPGLLAQFAGAAESVEIKSPDGRVLGRFVVDNLYKLPPGMKSPFSEDELTELRKQKGGRPLSEIIRDLEKQYPS